jgi:integrase
VEGKRHTVYGRTRQEAAHKLADLQRQATASGALADAGKRTLADLLAYYLENVAPSLKPRTVADYRQTATLYILPALGDIPLSRLTPSKIQACYRTLQGRGLTRAPLKTHRLLHRVCKLAVLWGWLSSNPCERVLPPTYRAPRKELWSAFQLHAFLTGTREHRFYPLWVLLLGTGVRIGEALALTWADVSQDAVTVSKVLHRIGGAWVTGAPKTASGRRVIALPPEVSAALAPLRGAPESLVFANSKGGFLGASLVEHALAQECDRLGLPRVTPHGFRHWHASMLLSAGAGIADVAARLGHANASITLSVYSHAIRGGDRQAAATIGEAMNRR